jgi:hypothetical protein
MALIRSFIHQIGHEMQILSASLKVLFKQVCNCCELGREMQILSASLNVHIAMD